MIDLRTELLKQRERIQDDIICILDGIEDEGVLDSICQVVVDRFAILLDTFTITD